MAGEARLSAAVIVPFRDEHAAAFRRLNLDWIERLFEVEGPDLEVLDDPQGAILEPGGAIFMALDGDLPVGAVAMIACGQGRYELAKMCVAASHQGRGIGEALGRACMAWARAQSAKSVFLETNSALSGAIRLYERLGFRHAPFPVRSDYSRADVYMEMTFGKTGS
jgi:GNAT superfamily N-acetyltransferase